MNEPLISIVIPTHNRKKMAERLIRSIKKSTYKNLDILVIDDASSDGTYEYLKKIYPNGSRTKIIKNKKNLFTAGTRNVGQKKAQGKYILFIDDDNVVDPRMIEEMVRVLEKDEVVGIVGPLNYSFKDKKKLLWAGTYRNMFTTKTFHKTALPKSLEVWDTPDVPNAFMVRRDVVENRVEFKKFYGIMYEESDYAYRVKNLGYKVLVARKAKIYHDAEEYIPGGQVKDYMFHFMEDPRRPYVFARNRIVFHATFSNKLEFAFILFFWIWVFCAYYSYRIMFYSGYGKFSIFRRLNLVSQYIKGIFSGISLISSGRKI